MYILILMFLLSFNCHAKTLVLIGGGERPTAALKYFIAKKLPGPIVVLPWGTQYPEESFATIKDQLESLGANNIKCLCASSTSPNDLNLLQSAGALYFPGGDQNLIMHRILASKLEGIFTALYERHVPMAGTSAGTAIQSNPMLTGDGAQTSRGLGLLQNMIVDQHFIVRQRQERLLSALSEHRAMHGMGIDENMSVVVEDNHQFKALGPSQVWLYLRNGDKLKKIILQNKQSFILR